jgi:hypothetical protein
VTTVKVKVEHPQVAMGWHWSVAGAHGLGQQLSISAGMSGEGPVAIVIAAGLAATTTPPAIGSTASDSAITPAKIVRAIPMIDLPRCLLTLEVPLGNSQC